MHELAEHDRRFVSEKQKKKVANGEVKWMFPKIMVPPNHQYLNRVVHPKFLDYKPSMLGYHYFWKDPCIIRTKINIIYIYSFTFYYTIIFILLYDTLLHCTILNYTILFCTITSNNGCRNYMNLNDRTPKL